MSTGEVLSSGAVDRPFLTLTGGAGSRMGMKPTVTSHYARMELGVGPSPHPGVFSTTRVGRDATGPPGSHVGGSWSLYRAQG